MRFRRILFSVAALLVAMLIGAWFLIKHSPEVTLSFTQAQLQEQLAPRFPAKKCVLSACIELLAPRLSLTEGSDRITIETSFLATLGHRTMPGTSEFSGRPYYEPLSGNFYLQDVQVSKFEMTGNAPDFNEVVRVRGPGIVAAIMNRFPLYSVQSHPKYGTIAKLALKTVHVTNGTLQVVFVNPLLLMNRK